MGDRFNAVIASPHGKAAFSRCGRYRWWLRRQWRQEAPVLLFIGLNPSSADGRRADPTLRRLIGFAEGWGYGAVEVVNLFAWVSTDPADLHRAAEPVGHRTDAWIRHCVRRLQTPNATATTKRANSVPANPGLSNPDLAHSVLARAGARPGRDGQPGDPGDGWPEAVLPLWLGWGNGGRWRGRDRQVLQLLSRLPVRLLCLEPTAGGQPRHPLYVHGGSRLQPFAPSWEHTPAAPDAPCPAPRAAMRST